MPRPVSSGAELPPRRLLRGTEKLQYLVGTVLLVGVTIRTEGGEVLSREQFFGEVLEVADGVVVVRRGEDEAYLPADPDAYDKAPRGTYRLASGGEVVNPDYLSTWDVLPGPGEA